MNILLDIAHIDVCLAFQVFSDEVISPLTTAISGIASSLGLSGKRRTMSGLMQDIQALQGILSDPVGNIQFQELGISVHVPASGGGADKLSVTASYKMNFGGNEISGSLPLNRARTSGRRLTDDDAAKSQISDMLLKALFGQVAKQFPLLQKLIPGQATQVCKEETDNGGKSYPSILY